MRILTPRIKTFKPVGLMIDRGTNSDSLTAHHRGIIVKSEINEKNLPISPVEMNRLLRGEVPLAMMQFDTEATEEEVRHAIAKSGAVAASFLQFLAYTQGGCEEDQDSGFVLAAFGTVYNKGNDRKSPVLAKGFGSNRVTGHYLAGSFGKHWRYLVEPLNAKAS